LVFSKVLKTPLPGLAFEDAGVYKVPETENGVSSTVTTALKQWYSTLFVRVPPDVIALQLCTPNVVHSL
jgi:hypothetical protein